MRWFITIISLLTGAQAKSQDFNLFEKATYASSGGKNLPFRILYPENYDSTKKYPLVLFLHGAGERGKDNEKQLKHGATLFLKAELRKSFPCFVVSPQCPSESFWSSMDVDRTKTPSAFVFDYSKALNWPLRSAIELIRKIAAEERVDTRRVYIVGLSMGGMGTFEAVYHYPGMFAAAIPICGGGDAARYDRRVVSTSFWIFHGDQDPAVDVKYSRVMVDKLKELKADLKYTEYPGVAHNSWDNTFAEPDFMNWLFSHQLK